MRSRRVRLATWLYTGPPGHLYGALADWAELLGRHWWAQLRRRYPR